MKNPINQTLIDRAYVLAENQAAKFQSSCTDGNCNCPAHVEYNRLHAAIKIAENFPNEIQNRVEKIEGELK